MKNKYKKQKKVSEEGAVYGIKEYSEDQKQLHKDIMELLTSERFKEISADDCLIVFGRIYSIYVGSQLLKEKKILINKGGSFFSSQP